MDEHLMIVTSDEWPESENDLPNNLYVKGGNLPNESGLDSAWSINKTGMIESPVIWWIGYAKDAKEAIEKCRQNWEEKHSKK